MDRFGSLRCAVVHRPYRSVAELAGSAWSRFVRSYLGIRLPLSVAGAGLVHLGPGLVHLGPGSVHLDRDPELLGEVSASGRSANLPVVA